MWPAPERRKAIDGKKERKETFVPFLSGSVFAVLCFVFISVGEEGAASPSPWYDSVCASHACMCVHACVCVCSLCIFLDRRRQEYLSYPLTQLSLLANVHSAPSSRPAGGQPQPPQPQRHGGGAAAVRRGHQLPAGREATRDRRCCPLTPSLPPSVLGPGMFLMLDPG